MRYDVERAVVMLSVRELCSLATAGGDLDLRPGKSRFSNARAMQGMEAHKQVRAQIHERYDCEVPLTDRSFLGDLAFEVKGRADGVFYTDPLTVHEIKSVSGRAFDLPPVPAHLAQLKCYAHFLCRARGLAEIRIRLTLYRIEDGKTRHCDALLDASELEEFYRDLLSHVEFFARHQRERATVRLPSARNGHFPYSSVRQGQDILLKECYRDIRAGKRLFAEAPTGTGKTMSSLYPAVRTVGEGICDKIFYLTAKASTRREAFRAARDIFEAGSHLRTVVLTAREQLCQNGAARNDPAGISRHCNPLDCPLAKGYYDRVGNALACAVGEQSGFSRSAILDIAARFGICPYEFQLDLSELCDIIICDYNYAFDPQVYLRRYFEPDAAEGNRYVFLVDEAHNLGDRACSMYSAELDNLSVLRVCEQLPEGEEKLRRSLEQLSRSMHGLRRLCSDNLHTDTDGVERGYYLSRNPLSELQEKVSDTRLVLDAWLRSHRGVEGEGAVYLLAAAFKRFELISEHYDERFLTFVELEGEKRTLRLICLDPSRVLDEGLSRAHAAVLFSATLTPQDYFADVLGGGKGAVRISLPSPFAVENFCPVALTSVSTRFEDRAKSYKRIASCIAATVSAKQGNYIVYFPSYQYLAQVHAAFSERYPSVVTVLQTPSMTAAQRDAFLDAFRDDGTLRVGFCVLGGSFSEGVDLPGKRLIGTVIVGTGLPAISNERNILREYYDVTRERGYDYAYVYPGMNRVLQAAGRVIRREDDCGVVVLIDDRYATPQMQALFPDHWNHMQYAENPHELAEIVDFFWKGRKKLQ